MKIPEDVKKLQVEAFDEAIHNLEVLKEIFALEEIKAIEAIEWIGLSKKNFEGIQTLIETSILNLATLVIVQKVEDIKKEKSNAS